MDSPADDSDWLVILGAEARYRQEEGLIGGYGASTISILDPAVAAGRDRLQEAITTCSEIE